jgi:hypothetical protein
VTYPDVLSEQATLNGVVAGKSLARYGDGEFALASGRGIKCQRHDRRLQDRLCGILRDSGECWVGIPRLCPESPKLAYWQARVPQFAKHLTDRPYVSALISRPDSAPWVNTVDYWARLESLWAGQDVTLVCGGERALSAADLTSAASVRVIQCPSRHAFAEYDDILERIGTPSRVLLCLGPTATVLAVDLCARGVHAVDLGHTGIFWRKYRAGERMVVTDADKAAA